VTLQKNREMVFSPAARVLQVRYPVNPGAGDCPGREGIGRTPAPSWSSRLRLSRPGGDWPAQHPPPGCIEGIGRWEDRLRTRFAGADHRWSRLRVAPLLSGVRGAYCTGPGYSARRWIDQTWVREPLLTRKISLGGRPPGRRSRSLPGAQCGATSSRPARGVPGMGCRRVDAHRIRFIPDRNQARL